jgi:4'-phosphopantetheinyl transferase EntD
MPLLFQKEIEEGLIGLWSISEELDELLLMAGLSEQDKKNFSEISALHRKKEWLATRVLLAKMVRQPDTIKYHNDGRPFLGSGLFNISISHTTGCVAVLLHRYLSPGVDIELISRQAARVASRFLSPEEYDACYEKSEYSNIRLLLYWCAKEAVFKMVPYSNIEFSTDIRIMMNDLPNDQGSLQGIFNDQPEPVPIQLHYMIRDGVVLVWGVLNELKLRQKDVPDRFSGRD